MNGVPALQHVVLSRSEFIGRTVIHIRNIIKEAVASKGSALIGFTGSPSLGELYASLGLDQEVQWSQVYFFSVDESYTPQNPQQSGSTLRTLNSAFHHPDPSHLVTPATAHLGPTESARRYERLLEGLERIADLIIVSVESNDGSTAGYRNPVAARAFSKDCFALSIHNAPAQEHSLPPPYAEYTISVSLSLILRAKQLLIVLPTREQSEYWRNVVTPINVDHAAEKIEKTPAAALLSHPALRIVSVDDAFTRQYIY